MYFAGSQVVRLALKLPPLEPYKPIMHYTKGLYLSDHAVAAIHEMCVDESLGHQVAEAAHDQEGVGGSETGVALTPLWLSEGDFNHCLKTANEI